jgi:SAM-dependent methyltransferase
MSAYTPEALQAKQSSISSKAQVHSQFIFSPPVIEAYYRSAAFELVCALDAALEDYNNNRRKALPDELDFRPKGFFSEGIVEPVESAFWKLHDELNQLYESAPSHPEFTESLGKLIQLNLKPWMYLSYFSKRVLEKPEGFIGDHQTIELMYRGHVNGIPNIHPLGMILDNLFLAMPTCQAVRDRRKALGVFIANLINKKDCGKDTPLLVTSFGCGKAREIYDLYLKIDPELIKTNLVDIDTLALSSARDSLNRIPKVRRQVTVIEFDIKRLNQIHLSISDNQDLVYSAGLLDYFDDELFISYLKCIRKIIKKNGFIVVGNYSSRNQSKGLMHYLTCWDLKFRDEKQLEKLLELSNIEYSEYSFFHDKTHKIQPFLVIKI